MDELNPPPPPPPEPAPEPQPRAPEPPAPPPEMISTTASASSTAPLGESREPRSGRRLMGALITLYLCSALAAIVLLSRNSDSPAKDLLPATKSLLSKGQANVGWVSIHGPISHSGSGKVWDRGVEQWGKRIKTLADKSDIKAIVLDINSPGGSVGAVQELYSVINRVRQEKKKPVVAVVGDVAASGGYYLAVACDKVVAHPGSLLGSIGVIFGTMNVEQLMSKIGVKADPIKSGKHKDIGSPTRQMTKEERELLQALIDDAYGQFLQAVVSGRSIPEEKARPLADGRIFTGQQALGLGLVDVLGDTHDAILLAGKLGGVQGTPRVTRDSDSIESLFDLLDSRFAGLFHARGAVTDELRKLGAMGLEYRWTGF